MQCLAMIAVVAKALWLLLGYHNKDPGDSSEWIDGKDSNEHIKLVTIKDRKCMRLMRLSGGKSQER